ncbi:acyltransferase family protein [Kitasatospora sp. NBC_00240]|uniref:acyltransferase family protein n=1 Tax=Kitasatospora sp. NBC_00240 TaxID=2903567 RepID=UPI00224DF218|nr:acyltransferase family protein [Kitasatospora sp. NBC_00240]MCX5214367.1 acyltransferase family protein [Kitasatospora sp. NBC_00240]
MAIPAQAAAPAGAPAERYHGLDALRGFALLLGVLLHATLAFIPGFSYTGWPIVDNSPSSPLAFAYFVIHLFRMPVFFLLAGFFGRMQYRRLKARGFFKERSKRILLPLLFGTLLVLPMNVILIAVVLGIKGPVDSLVPARAIVPVPLAHLWFLWVLYWLYVAVLVGHKLLGLFRKGGAAGSQGGGALERAVGRVCALGLEPVVLALPVAVCLWFFDQWHLWEGLPTPNTDLVPQLPTTVGYAVAFSFGWYLQKNPGTLQSWRRRWVGYVAAAVVVTVATAALGGFDPQSSLVTIDGQLALEPLTGGTKALCALGYGLAGWLWTLGLVGAALHFFAGFSPLRRYIADASYWIYIVHMPLVMALQVVVRHWPVHWALKYPFILAVALPILFLSYHYLVRSTWIGKMLNGRRYPRTLPTDPAARPAVVVGADAS